MLKNKNVVTIIVISIVIIIAMFYLGYKNGYKTGYKTGYDVGYANALESVTPAEKPKNDTVQVATAVKTETQTTIRPKTQQEIVSNAPAVQIKTEAPKIVASVNGKKYDFKPQNEVLDTTIKTTGVINVKIPERRWSIGLGIGKNKKPAYMLKAPIKGAVGAWIAGQDKHNVMGGISISF